MLSDDQWMQRDSFEFADTESEGDVDPVPVSVARVRRLVPLLVVAICAYLLLGDNSFFLPLHWRSSPASASTSTTGLSMSKRNIG